MGNEQGQENIMQTVQLNLRYKFDLHLLDVGPMWQDVELTRKDALEYYEKMMMVRTLEKAAHKLYQDKEVRGFVHESNGEEASPVGITSALEASDSVINGYRVHGWAHVMGAQPEEVLCELTGGINGISHGKGGSMHLYTPNFFGGRGIVGAQISLGTGIALAKKYRNEPGVSVAIFGDGAANQGQFYESANMAALWKLPVIYICENNGYAMFTSLAHHSASTKIYSRYSFMPGIRLDGMDVLSVREAVRFARKHCMDGKGPIFLELDTYRYVGHQETDTEQDYRSKEEVQKVKENNDPIKYLREVILINRLAIKQELDEIDNKVGEIIAIAVQEAKADSGLPIEGLYTDIYANTPPVCIRGRTSIESCIQKYTTTEELVCDLQKFI